MMTSAIKVDSLVKRYGNFPALDGFSVDLKPGQVVGLLGENGCGKTTLMKILAGVLMGYEGSVEIAGFVPGPESKARVSFLPDQSFLADGDTVARSAKIFADFFSDFDMEKFNETLKFFGINAGRKLSELSKGMREKAQVALAMSRDAEVFILDEPISGVDPAAREVILRAVVRNLNPESLVLISTHMVREVEPVLDRAIMMRHGKTLLEGEADEMRAEHGKGLEEIFKEMYQWSEN